MPAAPENRLLSLLEPADRERLQPHLTPVKLEYKQLLYGERKRVGTRLLPLRRVLPPSSTR